MIIGNNNFYIVFFSNRYLIFKPVIKKRDYDTAMGLKAIAYNLMVVSNIKSGEKAREIKKIVVC